jgi:zinc protease
MRINSLLALFLLIGCSSPEPILRQAGKSVSLPTGPYGRLSWVPRGEEAEFVPARPVEVVLGNGVRVLLLPDRSRPVVDCTVRLSTGKWHDPRGKTGAAELTAKLLRSGGSEQWPGDRLDEELAFRGARLEAKATFFASQIRAVCLKEDFQDIFGMLADVLKNPVFPQEKVSLALEQAMAEVRQRNDDPQSAATREARRAFFGKMDSRSRRMELKELATFGMEDFADFHRENYGSRGAMISVVGDFDSDELLLTLRNEFESWPVQTASAEEVVLVSPRSKGGRIFLADREDVNQTEVRFLLEGVRRDHPDYPALRLASYILGTGGFTNRMMKEVRTVRGLAYWAMARWSPEWLQEGVFVAASATKSETTAEIIMTMQSVMKEFLESDIGRKEFDEARDRMLHAEVFSVDTSREVLTRAADLRFHSYPWNYYDQLSRMTLQLKPADVLTAARRHLNPENLTLFVMGNSANFERPLQEFGTLIPWNDSESLEAKGENVLPRMKVTEDRAAGEELRLRLLASHGGAVAIENAGALSWTSVQGKASRELTFLFPTTLRETSMLGQDQQVSVISEDGGWASSTVGTRDMDSEQHQQSLHALSVSFPAVLLALARGEFLVSSAADQRLLLSHEDGRVIRLELTESGLIRKISTPLGNFQYSGYALFHGLQLPTRGIQEETKQEEYWSQWQVNPTVSPDWFLYPTDG